MKKIAFKLLFLTLCLATLFGVMVLTSAALDQQTEYTSGWGTTQLSGLEKIGARVDTGDQMLAGVGIQTYCSGNTTTGVTGTFNVYAWDTDPATSVAGTVLRTATLTEEAQGFKTFMFDVPLPAGVYYFEIARTATDQNKWTAIKGNSEATSVITNGWYYNDAGYYEQYQGVYAKVWLQQDIGHVAATDGLVISSDVLGTITPDKSMTVTSEEDYAVWTITGADSYLLVPNFKNYAQTAPYVLIKYKSSMTDLFAFHDYFYATGGGTQYDPGSYAFYGKTGLERDEWAYAILDLTKYPNQIMSDRIDPAFKNSTGTLHIQEIRFFSSKDALFDSIDDSIVYTAEMLYEATSLSSTTPRALSYDLSADKQYVAYTWNEEDNAHQFSLESMLDNLVNAPYVVIKYKANFAHATPLIAGLTSKGAAIISYAQAPGFINTGIAETDEYEYLYINCSELVANEGSLDGKSVIFEIEGKVYDAGALYISEIRLFRSADDYAEYIKNNSKFTSASVTVADDYSVNFKVSEDILNSDLVGSYNVTIVGENGITLENVVGVKKGHNYVFSFGKIGPHQMGHDITATLNVYDTSNNLIATDVRTYSIKEYCENKLADATSSDELKTMLKDMLNYGAAAQKYVSPAIDDSALVNNGIDTETTTTSPSASAEGFVHTPNGTVGFTTASVRLNNGVEIILKTAGTTNAVTAGSETLTLTDGIYVHRISLLDLTAQYTYTVDGAKLVYSLPIYIARSSSAADEDTKALLTQLMEFGVSLNAWKNAA